MSYIHTKYEIRLARRADLNSAADITGATWGPALVPHRVIGLAAIIDNDIAATGVIKFDKRPTFGSDSGRGDGDVGVLNLTTAHTQGKVVYKEVDVRIVPGEEVVAQVTDVTGASDTADVVIYVQPDWERPANVTAMVASS